MQTFTETFLLVNALEAHALVALTFNVPPQLPAFTVNEAVPCPEIIDHPVGTCHVYVLAPGTNVHVYVVVCDLQNLQTLNNSKLLRCMPGLVLVGFSEFPNIKSANIRS